MSREGTIGVCFFNPGIRCFPELNSTAPRAASGLLFTEPGVATPKDVIVRMHVKNQPPLGTLPIVGTISSALKAPVKITH